MLYSFAESNIEVMYLVRFVRTSYHMLLMLGKIDENDGEV